MSPRTLLTGECDPTAPCMYHVAVLVSDLLAPPPSLNSKTARYADGRSSIKSDKLELARRWRYNKGVGVKKEFRASNANKRQGEGRRRGTGVILPQDSGETASGC